MDKLPKIKAHAGSLCALVACLSGLALPAQAGTKTHKAQRTPAVFDIATRKTTRKTWGPHVSGAAYAALKLSRRGNLERDDGVFDHAERVQAYLGFAARADLGRGVTGFVHAEASVKHAETSAVSYGLTSDLQIKEALLSMPLAPGVQISAGRMRFQDADKWVADSAVDGVHLGRRWGTPDALRGVDLAFVRGTGTDASDYALAHLWRMDGGVESGAFMIAEAGPDGDRLHVTGYHSRTVSARFAYHINAAAVLGDLPQGRDAGFGSDLRATRTLNGALKPQFTFGLAAGSAGFRQTGLHSNKTYDGGQTQTHRYGEVFRPDLTNLAVATLAYGLRPSKKVTVTLSGYAYARLSTSGPAPTARFDGVITGSERFLGTEVNLSGAWRPTKKSKVEFGVGRFQPSAAFADHSSSTRLFARYTINF